MSKKDFFDAKFNDLFGFKIYINTSTYNGHSIFILLRI